MKFSMRVSSSKLFISFIHSAPCPLLSSSPHSRSSLFPSLLPSIPLSLSQHLSFLPSLLPSIPPLLSHPLPSFLPFFPLMQYKFLVPGDIAVILPSLLHTSPGLPTFLSFPSMPTSPFHTYPSLPFQQRTPLCNPRFRVCFRI